MKQVSIRLSSVLLIMTTLLIVHSCKKRFDAPPGPSDPNLTATHTIAQLKAMHTVGGAYDVINTDMIISGIVIANDFSGNLYKQIYIQDATGALQILLDATGLYNSYPVGRKVFIKVKGLCLSDYNGLMELGVKATVSGTPSIQAIASNLIGQYLIGGSINNPVVPKVVTISQLTTDMQDPNIGALIQLNDYEFLAGDTSKSFSDTSAYKNTTNLTVRSCSPGTDVIIRTSAYARFAGVNVPNGNGKLLSIYTVFRTTKQLIIRDTSDVQFTGSRCSLFEEDFESTTSATDISLPGWKNIGEVGNVLYRANLFGGTRFAQASAFNSPGYPPVVTSWLITPPIKLTAATANLNFQTIDGFNNGASLTVLISTNYNGSATPSTATWTTLASSTANPGLFAGPTTTGYASTWKNSGNINLASYLNQTVYIAFRYDGANPATGTRKTTTWEIDNVKITR